MSGEPRFKQVGRQLSNWGRWGPDDQLGTLNHLTADDVRSAAALVVTGERFELSRPLGKDGPQTQLRVSARVNPLHLMAVLPGDLSLGDGVDVADDYVVMPLQAGTQWDALSHVGYDDLLYNGVPTSVIRGVGGATRNSIDATLPGFAGRAVLLDIARLHGVDWLPVEHAITPDQLDAAERAQGVSVGRADTVLVRTGWMTKALAEGWAGWLDAEPGLTLDCATWLHERDVCAVASDNWGVEKAPWTSDGVLAVHCVLIRDLGMMLGEMWVLDSLAAACATDGRWDFLLVAPALRVTGAVGSPVSPIAIR